MTLIDLLLESQGGIHSVDFEVPEKYWKSQGESPNVSAYLEVVLPTPPPTPGTPPRIYVTLAPGKYRLVAFLLKRETPVTIEVSNVWREGEREPR